jgi:hypothetical protein
MERAITDEDAVTVLTDDCEADLGVTSGRLAEVHATPVLAFITLVHVVQ